MRAKKELAVKQNEDLIKEIDQFVALAMEGKIRKDRQKMIYERQQLKEQIISVIGIIILCVTVVGFIVFILMLLKNKYGW